MTMRTPCFLSWRTTSRVEALIGSARARLPAYLPSTATARFVPPMAFAGVFGGPPREEPNARARCCIARHRARIWLSWRTGRRRTEGHCRTSATGLHPLDGGAARCGAVGRKPHACRAGQCQRSRCARHRGARELRPHRRSYRGRRPLLRRRGSPGRQARSRFRAVWHRGTAPSDFQARRGPADRALRPGGHTSSQAAEPRSASPCDRRPLRALRARRSADALLFASSAPRVDRGVSEPEERVRSLLDAGELAAIARRLGREIKRDYPDGVVLVALLKGSICFLADLVRELPGPCELDFLSLSSYGDGRTRVRVVKDLDLDVTGRDVIVVLDIVDTGLTLAYVLRLIALRGARSTAACALLDRQSRRLLPVEVRYVGQVISDEHVVGYGLDLDERYRNLRGLEVAGEADLRADPAAMFERLWQRYRK